MATEKGGMVLDERGLMDVFMVCQSPDNDKTFASSA